MAEVRKKLPFCNICGNLPIPSFNNDEMTFKCMSCGLTYESNAEDSLRYERLKESDVMLHEKILDKASVDPATIKAMVDCIKTGCKSKIVKQVRLGDDLRLYNICVVCNTKWLN